MIKKLIILLIASFSFLSFAYGAVDCDGSDDVIEGLRGTIPSRQPITIMAYVKTGSLANTDHDVVSSWSDGDSLYNWILGIGYDGNIDDDTILGVFHDGTKGYYYYAGVVMSDNTYYWVTTSFDGVTINDYINDTKYSGVNSWDIGNTNVEDDVALGAKPDGNGAYFDGKVYIVAIWDKVLTDAEVSLIVNSGMKDAILQVEPANLKALYSLDDEPDGTSGDGDTFLDRVGGNNLTGDDGSNNTGLTCKAEDVLTYP